MTDTPRWTPYDGGQRWTPLREHEVRSDEDGEPESPLPWIWDIATSEIVDIYKIQPNMIMIRDMCRAILDRRELRLDDAKLFSAMCDTQLGRGEPR